MVDPGVFGPCFWKTIHYICIGAPKQLSIEDKRYYKLFFNNLQYWIPCDICSEHYEKNVKKIDIDKYLNENRLFEFSVDLHNIVNKMLGKREWSIDEAYQIYKFNNINNNNTFHIIIEVILGIIVILLLILLLRK
jgi:hypothetical protein